MTVFRHTSEQGFVLAMTLWIMAALIGGAAFFSAWVSRSIEDVGYDNEEFQGLVDGLSTRSVILYLLASQPVNQAGLTLPDPETDNRKGKHDRKIRDPLSFKLKAVKGNEIALDGRLYRGTGNTCFSIQDEAGLVGINTLNPEYLRRLLGLLNVPAVKISSLIDKILDYIDRNDLKRLNGAEAEDYRSLDLPPPPNRFLITGYEARNVLSWNDYKQLWEDNIFPELVTTFWSGIPNFNTAPFDVLQTVPGIDAGKAEKIIKKREERAFVTINDIYTAIGKKIFIDPLSISYLSSANLRIKIYKIKVKEIEELTIKITPGKGNDSPWLTDYKILLHLKKETGPEGEKHVPCYLFKLHSERSGKNFLDITKTDKIV